MDFQIGHVSHYICDTCTLFQESDLPMKTALKLHVCPSFALPKEERGNWKSVLYSMFIAFWQFDYVNSQGLFLHAVSFSVNKDSVRI